jgi:hypothetical protein
MFRKSVLALAAVASLGAAALVPTAASAHYRHFHPHFGFYAAPAYVYGGCVWKKQWYDTHYGPRFRWIKVCY